MSVSCVSLHVMCGSLGGCPNTTHVSENGLMHATPMVWNGVPGVKLFKHPHQGVLFEKVEKN